MLLRYFSGRLGRLVLWNGKKNILMNRIGNKRKTVIYILLSRRFFHDDFSIISRLKNQIESFICS
ncbi:MAG: hypothetical protein BWX55_00649 [Deltaproteobacteria bacterium ADurb.Bin022]|nr:MAG: hypothetical protein BWX55_00649 [Deltaproteobacteria bacterium ADurb.Bin022]